jgi:hypothetical protein
MHSTSAGTSTAELPRAHDAAVSSESHGPDPDVSFPECFPDPRAPVIPRGFVRVGERFAAAHLHTHPL